MPVAFKESLAQLDTRKGTGCLQRLFETAAVLRLASNVCLGGIEREKSNEDHHFAWPVDI